MTRITLFVSLLSLFAALLAGCATRSRTPEAGSEHEDMFQTLLGKSEAQVQAKIDAAWNHLFYGDDDNERIYYEVGDDMAYVIDINNHDVRSEGISYGMMIAVQMDKQEEFNRIWKWAKTYMYQTERTYAGYFAWHTHTDGTPIHHNPASDGEIWITTALFLAAHRWGNGEGIFDYEAEANAILHTMIHKDEEDSGIATPIFDPETKLVVFVPTQGRSSEFTDPSYHVPHYYNLWAQWAAEDNDFWREATEASRAYLKLAEHPETGLMPDYAEFDGTPVQFNGPHDRFAYDAWRTTMNIAVDHAWNGADPWQVEHVNRVLNFFYSEGIDSYKAEYSLDGEALVSHRGMGLIAVNGAAAALASTEEHRAEFVQELWDLEPPSGQYRYYDGLLYLMSLLMASGNFQAY
jgi:oligosaccharide reducing-end xylanase